MRSDFVATISRAFRSSINSETHESQLEALKDLLGNWEDSSDQGYDSIGETLCEEMDPDASNIVFERMLSGMDVEWLVERLKAAEFDFEKTSLELVREALKAHNDDDVATLLQEFGYYKRETPDR